MKKIGILKKQPRITAIDLLRGLFIIVMLIDHVARFPNGLDYFSGRNALWFSAAEGFVTLSGMLVGYVYFPKFVRNSQDVVKRLLRRAALLYACVIGLALFFIAYSYYAFAATDFNHFRSIWEMLFQLLTLQYSYGWAEFLTNYVIFLLLAPLVLYAIAKRKAWIPLSASFLLWLFALPLSEGQTRYEFAASWQLLFVFGIFIGSHLLDINKWITKRFKKQTITRATYSLWGVALIIYSVAILLSYGATDIGNNISALQPFMGAISTPWEAINTAWFAWWTDKATLAPLRILFGVIVFWALFTFFLRYSEKIDRYTDGVLMTVGTKPLVAYSVGAVIIFIIEKYIPQPDAQTRHFIANLFITIVAITLTYLITKHSGRFGKLFKRV